MSPYSATSPRKLIYTVDKISLYHYTPLHKNPFVTPLLIVFSTINRADILDLSHPYSFIRNLLETGLDVYLLDWGYPDADDYSRTLTDYILHYLKQCINTIQTIHAQKKLSLLGICQGGIFSLCYACLFPQHIKNLITLSTPIDFHTPDNIVTQLIKGIDINLLANNGHNVQGHWITSFFLSLKPFLLLGKKYIDLLSHAENPAYVERFLLVEKWIYDSPNQAGKMFGEFIKNCYHDNNLIKGKMKIGGRNINMRKLNMPILNIIANQDHIIPPAASLALRRYVSSIDYTAIRFARGHIGIYINDHSRKRLAGKIADWLKQRT